MIDPFPLEPDAIAYLKVALQRFSDAARYPLSLGDLIERWRRFVIQVEAGYDDSIYEYVNDLAVRNRLMTIAAEGPLSLRAGLAACLGKWDQRFIEATYEGSGPLPGTDRNADSRWSSRIPISPQGELLDDLRAAGMI